MRHQIYMNFKDKIENQEMRNTEKVLALTSKLESTEKEYKEELKNTKNEYILKINNLYNLVKEKDESITELSSKIDDYKATLKDINENKYEKSDYTLITINNALRSNLKRSEREIINLGKQIDNFKVLIEKA
mmetsp:Transcript_4731/g.3990  ORF Transcript_4731/g.3990 Transcript_4731/m.3990 type:complete len:132 (+) Transcript_4731:658-1053(+)